MSQEQEQGTLVFFSYSHRDKALRDKLEEHLSILKYRGLISTWYDREIQAGQEWSQQIDIHLNNAHIILLLISASFMASGYCYGIEMKRALERHERQEAVVIPILLRPVLYTDAPFAKLQMLPTNGRPVIKWKLPDDAFCEIAHSVEKIAQKYSLPSSEKRQFYSVGPQMLPAQSMLSTLPRRAFLRRGLPRLLALPELLTLQFTSLIVSTILFAIIYILYPPPTNPTVNSNPTPLPETILLILLFLFLIISSFILFILLLHLLLFFVSLLRRIYAKTRRRKYYEEAIEVYQHALLRYPYDGHAFQGMGKALSALGRYDRAFDALRSAIAYLPASGKATLSAAYAGLGGALVKLKRNDEAVAAYEQAIALDFTVTFNHNDLIRALLASGRKEEAARIRERARQLGYEDI